MVDDWVGRIDASIVTIEKSIHNFILAREN